MKDNTYYFQHDYNASEDEKIIDLRADHGWEGYGLFWRLIEMLAQNDGLMHLQSKRIAFALNVDSEKIRSIIEDYGLFEFEGENFYSKRLSEQIKWRKDIKEKRKKAAEKRWSDNGSNANALHLQSKSNAQDRTGQDRTGQESTNKNGLFGHDKVFSVKNPTENNVKPIVSEYGYPKEFEDLYNLSGKKQQKLPALVKWLKLKESEREKVKSHWPEYTELVTPKYQRLFRTFLEQQGWEDDLSELRNQKEEKNERPSIPGL